jgi:hypothetical protein
MLCIRAINPLNTATLIVLYMRTPLGAVRARRLISMPLLIKIPDFFSGWGWFYMRLGGCLSRGGGVLELFRNKFVIQLGVLFLMAMVGYLRVF